MTFDDILEQVIALLKRHGRMSYSALRQRFDLDDAYLTDLKDELLFTYPVADEHDRGLVWTGKTEDSQLAPSQSDYPELEPVVEQTPPIQEISATVEPHTPEAERRLTRREIHRLKGDLLHSQSSHNAAEAESCFQHAITIAQYQSAKSWELRAATSLARLWRSQGKREEAHELLEPVYNWFTEGFDTADLIDAKALLDELEYSRS